MPERAEAVTACYMHQIDGCERPATWRYEEDWLAPMECCDHHHEVIGRTGNLLPGLWPGTWTRLDQ